MNEPDKKNKLLCHLILRVNVGNQLPSLCRGLRELHSFAITPPYVIKFMHVKD